MVKYLLVLLIFPFSALSQNKLEFGNVLSDTNFFRNQRLFYAEMKCGLDSISNSKNELEMRFLNFHLPSIAWDVFIIIYNDGVWTANKYVYNFGRKNYDSLQPVKKYVLLPRNGFDSLFDKLKKNQVFTLQSQEKLKIQEDISDGGSYVLSFKAGTKFRSYRFNNSLSYQKKYPRTIEFKYYSNILNLFYNELTELSE